MNNFVSLREMLIPDFEDFFEKIRMVMKNIKSPDYKNGYNACIEESISIMYSVLREKVDVNTSIGDALRECMRRLLDSSFSKVKDDK